MSIRSTTRLIGASALALFLLSPLGCPSEKAATSTSGSTSAESAEAPKWTDATELPFDSGVIKKVLPNGLTYYIERNAEPQNRTILRLVVGAGATSEDDDQLGLAHFVEHMAFNGSEHFEGNGIPEYLESLGMKFGAHLNAYTSFDETVYMLQVPTEDEAAMKQGFLVLRDWAQGLSFVEEEIEKERGVVLEEWRAHRGVGGRISDALVPLRFHGARYAERLPIGTEDSLKGFEPDAARRFYADWYRPELMAVVAVGDFDPAFIEQQIIEQFGGLSTPEGARPQVKPTLPGHDETLALVFADPELPSSQVLLGASFNDQEGNSFGDYRESALGRLANSILNERLAALTQQAEPPFLFARVGRSRLTWSSASDSAMAAVPEGGILSGLEALLIEVERARQHGFSQAELDRASAKAWQSMERSYAEKDKSPSGSAASELIRNFLKGETVPGIEVESEILRVILDGVTLDQVNAFAQDFLQPQNRFVAALLPEKEDLEQPSEDQLLAVLTKVAAMEIEPPAMEEELPPLLAEPPQPGTITEEQEIEAFDAVRWTLSNGVQVIVKSTDFKADEVLISGHSWGGHSLAEDEDWIAARAASALRAQSGLGEHDSSQLAKLLAGKRSAVSLRIGELGQTVNASSSLADLETTFQQLWMAAAQPRFDADAFARSKKARAERIANRLARPQTHMDDLFTKLVWQDHPRTRPWSLKQLSQLDLAKSEAFYKERTANWNGAVFVIVGSAEPATLRPFVERYLASLPSGAQPDDFRDVGKRVAPGVQVEVVKAGIEQKAAVAIRFSGEFASTPENRHALRSMVDVLKVLMREELREEKGGTYGVRVSSSTHEQPIGRYSINLRWGCDPARVDELVSAARATIDKLRAGPLDARYADTVREQEKRTTEVQKRENSYWRSAMLGNTLRGEPVEALQRYWDLSDSVTPESIHAAATKYIDPGRSVQVTLLPEDSGGQ